MIYIENQYMSAKKQNKSSKKPTTKQTSLDISKETIEKAIKEGKIILLSVDGEKHKMKAAELINNIIIDPKGMLTSPQKSSLRTHNYPLKPSTIDCLEFDEEKEFYKELKKYINSHSWFYTLFINNFRETYNIDDLVYILEKLKDSMEEKGRNYFKISHPDKDEIKKAILEKYEKYPIFKQIQKEKNRAYQKKEHLRKIEKALRNKKYKKPSVGEDGKIRLCSLGELKRDIGILESFHGEYSYNELTEDEKEEMKECTNDILIDNKSKIEKIISEVKPREKDELYTLILEEPPRSSIIINFHGNVPEGFREDFQSEYVEIPPPLSELKIEV